LVIFQTGLGQNGTKTLLLAGAILASAAFIMPNSPLWFAAGMLWIMDASINVSMEPFRAFVGDNLPENNVP
jgi:maltose/moltooligosaccharide transporter